MFMYKDIIANIAIIIASLAVAGQLFKMESMKVNLKTKLLGGIAGGLLGSILMFYSVKVAEHTIIDIRNFAIIIVVLYGGLSSGLVAAVIITAIRFLVFGINPSSLTALFVMVILSFLGSYLGKKQSMPAFVKFNILNLANILLFCTAITILVKDQSLGEQIYLSYSVVCLVGGFGIFYVTEYIARSNENYRKLREMASKDFLTGLNNVRQFDEVWNREAFAAKQTGEPLSLLIMDIDYFKSINDKYGHPDGDKILKQLGEILADVSRLKGGTAARNGGEEFSIILPGAAMLEAKQVAEEVRARVLGHDFEISDRKKIKITVSIGVGSFPDSIEDIDRLIKKADDHLYLAKNTGRNRVCA
ncbi:GGDEF domain-containing protein [Bacillus sp. EB01]|uniref:GGDEF domain-containing protein n=1 Tax=Bacillus sp. EB01 TaxID=1347086 RepID=UPI0005C68308|nr:diguanylate cyclase [Bacillus sp. EB01]